MPENAAAPAGRRVKLAFLRLQARSTAKAPPVFMLAGAAGNRLIQQPAFAVAQELDRGPALDIDYSMKHLDALRREDAKCRRACDLPALVERAVALFDAGPIAASFTDPGAALPLDCLELSRFPGFVLPNGTMSR